MRNWKTILVVGIFAVIALASLFWMGHAVNRLKAERDRYRTNTETLFSDVEKYRVRDSLSAARVESLELSVKEFERFRAQDAALIKELQTRNRDLSAINKTQSQTIIELQGVARDTVIIRDSVELPAIVVRCGDAWYDFEGVLEGRKFDGILQNRDSLVIVESVRYRRFLGFLWKTKRVKDRRMDCVSKNPHTEIQDIEYVTISK